MKPVNVVRIYFWQSVKPYGEQDSKKPHNHVIEGANPSVLDDDQQGEYGDGKVRHEDEFVLVDGRAFLHFSEQVGVQFVAEKFENVREKQQGEEYSDVGDERQLRHRLRNVDGAEHDQSGGYGHDVEE